MDAPGPMARCPTGMVYTRLPLHMYRFDVSIPGMVGNNMEEWRTEVNVSERFGCTDENLRTCRIRTFGVTRLSSRTLVASRGCVLTQGRTRRRG
ncbi:hypothetical protein FA13DRAFT_1073659 [Coprinellus micaceus]|uniref:Uncharacterized protein n=1 Tax=Coprinellus micaceus TaxID=71717 RepID=A0A4Y7TRT7_COPMI|nr:hypothetical protein FA13DRAFT_1073659 [Coprinellus micaceus]